MVLATSNYSTNILVFYSKGRKPEAYAQPQKHLPKSTPGFFFAHKPKIFEQNPGHFLESLTLPKTHTEQNTVHSG